MQHQATALIGRCYAGLDAAGMREEVLRLVTPDTAGGRRVLRDC